ncbi:MAG: alpha/beta hydrolase [Sulfitobacter sp.]
MTAPHFSFVPVLNHEIHVTEWGDPSAPALFMMHGLARTGRDFDELAAALSDRYHVLCPDMIGRGLSSWSANPSTEYRIEYYAAITLALLDQLGIDQTAWIGTSMGGQIGMRIASDNHRDKLSCLLINDIGPEVPETVIKRILAYVGNPPTFKTHAEAETWLRSTYTPFGPASEVFWQRMARTSLRRQSNGSLTMHYDPAITRQFVDAPQEMTCWDSWNKITTPTHVFFGAQSDLLESDILARMMTTGPQPDHTSFPDCGHAPTLSRRSDIALVGRILEKAH